MTIKYRPDIDGLRAVAVFLVVVYHAFPSHLTGGFIGVDVFFVISGFLITSIISKEIKNGKFTVIGFYKRRIDRIFPSLIIVMMFVFVFGWFVLLPDEYKQSGKMLAASSVFMTNIVLFRDVGYFDISSNLKPLLHLWSLGIEEQFYLAFPLILLIIKKTKSSVIFVLSILIVFSFLPNLYTNSPDRAFYLPQYRMWELLSGSILALSIHKITYFNKWIRNTLSFIGLILILAPSFVFTNDMVFPGWIITIPILGSILIIGFGKNSIINNYILSSKIFVFMGLISFPLYLWHWPLFSFANIISGNNTNTSTMLILLAASVMLSIFTYKAVETPLKKIRSSKFKTIPLLLSVLSIGILGFVTYIQNGLPDRSSMEYVRNANEQLTGPMWQYTQNKICMENYKTELSHEFPWWFCMLKKDSEPDMIIIGNSYANHLYPAFALNRNLKNINVLSIGKSDPTIGVDPNSNTTEKKQAIFIDEIIRNSPSIKYIILSGLNQRPTEDYIIRLKKRIGSINKENIKIIIFAPHLIIKQDIKTCLGRPLRGVSDKCTIPIDDIRVLRANFKLMQSSLTKEFPSLLFFDPNDIFCDESACSSIKNGLPLYRDEYSHLSQYASELIGVNFAEWAKINLPDITE